MREKAEVVRNLGLGSGGDYTDFAAIQWTAGSLESQLRPDRKL